MITQLKFYKNNIADDPNFKVPTNSSPWTLGTAWSIVGNQAKHTGTGTSSISQDILTIGVTYKITLTVTKATAVTVTVKAGTNTYSIPSTGTYTFNLLATSVTFSIESNNATTVDRVSVIPYPDVLDVDLSSDIDAPMTFNIADLRDPSKKNTNFSKTIILPGTKNNDLIFGHAFEISGEGIFNPNKKIRAVVTQDGLETFNGIAQLKKINRVGNGFANLDAISYEIVLFGNLADIFYQLGDSKLEDLDFSEYNHTYNKDNIKRSWAGTVLKNGVYVDNWLYGPIRTITSASHDAEGRVKLNFSTSHGFKPDEHIWVVQDGLTGNTYQGDHKIKDVTSTTSVTLFYPYDTNFGTGITGTAQTISANANGYVYPMIQYGETTAKPDEWNVNNFYPAIYVREITKKIFAKAGFTFTSTYFDSEDFKRLIIPFSAKELRLSEAAKLLRNFHAQSTSDLTVTYSITPKTYKDPWSGLQVYSEHNDTTLANPITYNPLPVTDKTTAPINFDAGGTYNASLSEWTCPVTGNYDMHASVFIEQIITFPANSYGGVGFQFTDNVGQAVLSITDISDSSVVPQTAFIKMLKRTFGTTLLKLDVPAMVCQAGHKYKLSLSFPKFHEQFYIVQNPAAQNALTASPNSGSVTVNIHAPSTFWNYSTNNTITEGETMPMNDIVPRNVTCKDFLSSLFKMFNLYIQTDPDNAKNLLIETRNDFYAQGTVVDWTSKLDTTQTLQIEPMGELSAKTYVYKDKEDKDFYNDTFKALFGQKGSYGDYTFDVDNDFVQNKIENATIFSPTLLDQNGNRVISQIWGGSKDGPVRIDSNIRLLYFQMAQSSINPSVAWKFTSLAAGSSNEYLYPYAGHLDKVEGPDVDLNWGFPFGFVKVTDYNFDAWSTNNTFNRYHKDMITEITNKNSKIITGYFNLTPKDIFSLSFKNLFLVNGHHLRLNKIIDYSLTREVPTQCEFLLAEKIQKFAKKSAITPYDFSVLGRFDASINNFTAAMPYPAQSITNIFQTINNTTQQNITNNVTNVTQAITNVTQNVTNITQNISNIANTYLTQNITNVTNQNFTMTNVTIQGNINSGAIINGNINVTGSTTGAVVSGGLNHAFAG